MIEIWYAILAFMIIGYVVFDGRNFGIGVLHLFVARTQQERRQVIAAVGPLWSWHEVWLISFGGVMFVAFPRLLGTAFSGYYLALFLILWCFVLRGMALEVGGHINDRMWQGFWDVVFAFANILLGILFGAALGNVARGATLDISGDFHMAFFTNFGVRGQVGLLDWYTVSVGVVSLVMLTAHAATYLTLKTDGPVHDRCIFAMRWLWTLVPVLFIGISIETWYVRPELAAALMSKPFAWATLPIPLIGAVALFTGIRGGLEWRTFVGSNLVIAGFLITGAVVLFPIFLFSTVNPENSLTAYNSSASLTSLELAMCWWPFALALSVAYWWFIVTRYPGKVKLALDDDKHY